jgi:hypothetical protein
MVLESTQPLTNMSSRNFSFSGVKFGHLERDAENQQSSVSRLSRKCGSLDVSQAYGLLTPAAGAALPLIKFTENKIVSVFPTGDCNASY